MSNKQKPSASSIDLSDIVGPTKQAKAQAPAETPVSSSSTEAVDQHTEEPKTIAVQDTLPPKEESSQVAYEASIPVRLSDSQVATKTVVACSPQEFMVWADSVFPLTEKLNPSLFNTPDKRIRAFNAITSALSRKFLFGGEEYKKKHFFN